MESSTQPCVDLRDLREYAWKYFDRHAEQRIKAFHFFVILETAVLAGILLVIKEPSPWSLRYLLVMGVMMTVFAFVFWKLDRRTRMMVRNGERALIALEAMTPPLADFSASESVKLFTNDSRAISSLSALPLIPGTFTYSTCFGTLFLTFGLLGLSVITLCLAAMSGQVLIE